MFIVDFNIINPISVFFKLIDTQFSFDIPHLDSVIGSCTKDVLVVIAEEQGADHGHRVRLPLRETQAGLGVPHLDGAVSTSRLQVRGRRQCDSEN